MATSKHVTQEFVKALGDKFKSSPSNLQAQNVATRHGIYESSVSYEKRTSRVHVFNCGVEESKPVTNQKASGRCWIFAMVNAIRQPFIKKYELSEFEFSQNFVYFWDKLERTNYVLEAFIETRKEPLEGRLMSWLLKDPYCDGGQWDMLVNIVNKYGLVPKDYFPETTSSESSRQFNTVLTNKVREYCHKLRVMDEEGKTEEDLRTEKMRMMESVYNICSIALGTPPTTFDWEYKSKTGSYQCHRNLTPKTFYETLVKPVFDIESKICLINDPRSENLFQKLYTVQYLGNVTEGYPVRYINLPVEDLKRYAINSLKAGEVVWFGCDVGAHFCRKAGLNDLNIHDTVLSLNTGLLGLGKAERLRYGESLMTHAMVLTAVHLKNKDEKEESPDRWRVENSWGGDSGIKGYLMMTDDWFSEFVYEVVVDKSVVPEDVIKVLEQSPIVLPPWDPMGALAH